MIKITNFKGKLHLKLNFDRLLLKLSNHPIALYPTYLLLYIINLYNRLQKPTETLVKPPEIQITQANLSWDLIRAKLDDFSLSHS
jgi:hypothetical protein